MGETDLQSCRLRSHQNMADAEGCGVKRKKKRLNMEAGSAWWSLQEKRQLRSPDDTEPETVVRVERVVVEALRATAIEGVEEPVAAAQQTGRTSRGSCGVGHAC